MASTHQEILRFIKLRNGGISILLSGQNGKSAMKLIRRLYVTDNGQIRFAGSLADLEANEEIKKKYLMV
jgi:branched-chain amino acid transport system ATP-binding protein